MPPKRALTSDPKERDLSGFFIRYVTAKPAHSAGDAANGMTDVAIEIRRACSTVKLMWCSCTRTPLVTVCTLPYASQSYDPRDRDKTRTAAFRFAGGEDGSGPFENLKIPPFKTGRSEG